MVKPKEKAKARSGKRFALTPLAAAVVAAMYPAAPMLAQESALEEIIVTAQKRTQNLQDVPISVQVLGNQQIEDLNLNGFEDYVAFLPAVSFIYDRPGIAQVYMRGIASGGDGNHSASMPSVGIYLDEQPITTINHVLDMHVYDVARIETLAGPQGSFFGASSQAGTIRIITNKPVIGEFEAGVDVSGSVVKEGSTGYTVEGFANIPISDNAAIRLVGWTKESPGYIDNVPGTITLRGTPEFVHDNAELVEEDFNVAEISGMRASLKVDLNENWTITPGIIYQQQDSSGVWQHDPDEVGDLQVQRFSPDVYEDQWYQASMTVEGDIDGLNIVYAGSLLDRDAERTEDYIGYAQYLQNYYYYDSGGCYHHATTSTYANYVCTDSDQFVSRDETFKRQSHEVRLQSDQDEKFRWTAGFFYQRQEHDFDLRWNVPGMDPMGSDIWPIRPPSLVPGDKVVWQTDQNRVDRDTAFFGEIEYNLTDDLTVVGGYRRFNYENSLLGYNGHASRGCFVDGVLLAPCSENAPNIDDVSEGDGNIFKASVNYQLNADKMVYATYSEGFRAGGVNRAKSAGQFVPKYGPDFVDNYEFGWKTTWLDGRLRFNGAVYRMEWDDFQLSYHDYDVSILTIIQNVGNAENNGAEFDLEFAPTEKLRLTLSASYNKAELGESFWTDLEDKEAGDPPDAEQGADMPYVPELKYSATGRLNVNYGTMPGYIQAALTYTGSSWNELKLSGRESQASYAIVNFATGIQNDDWSLDLFIDNAFDERADLTVYDDNYWDPYGVLTWQSIITTNRPRTVGLRYAHRFW
ncbi:MAG TPA: TonB-dependent receptor [Gammaproteobacteria bacterium]|nr:TonB-dependent receptor [Gammaproteobacteria bacterium]HIM04776.1 TonB-dependent receptor [Gammaproteobacteria bacterium]